MFIFMFVNAYLLKIKMKTPVTNKCVSQHCTAIMATKGNFKLTFHFHFKLTENVDVNDVMMIWKIYF